MNIMISVYDFHFIFHCWRFFFFFYNEKEQHNNNNEIKTNPCLIVKNIIITYKGITLKKKNQRKKKYVHIYVGIGTK